MSLANIIRKKNIKTPFIVHILLWAPYFIYAWINALVVTKGGIVATNLAHWADGAAHLTYMSAFGLRERFPLEHPVFADHVFNYSFAADLLGGLLLKVGFSHVTAYNAVGLILSLILIIILYWFAKKITGSGWTATLAGILFMFSGGLGFRYFIKDATSQGFFKTLSKLPRLYTQQEDVGLVWLNTVVGELLPQRAFLLGLIFGLIILGLLYQHFVKKEPLKDYQLPMIGILMGLLPITHPHTLIYLLFTLPFLFVYSLITAKPGFYTLKRKEKEKRVYGTDWLIIALPAVLIGVMLSAMFILPALGEGFIRTQIGWMAKTKQVPWIWFWLNNWGLFFPLSLLLPFIYVKQKSKLTLLIPTLLTFVLANLVLFQPYEWDNAKLFTWVYLINSILIAHLLLHPKKLIPLNLKKNLSARAYQAGAIFVVAVLIFAGALDVLNTLQFEKNASILLSQEEISLAQAFNSRSNPEDRVLTATFHRHWVPTLTGRQILLGYRGWIWTYGIKDAQRIADIERMYQGGEAAEQLLKRYRIDYVVVGPMEKHEFKVNQKYFDTRFESVISQADTAVYRVSF